MHLAVRFRELEAEYEGLSFVPLMDQGDYIYLIINSILSSLGWGALLLSGLHQQGVSQQL